MAWLSSENPRPDYINNSFRRVEFKDVLSNTTPRYRVGPSVINKERTYVLHTDGIQQVQNIQKEENFNTKKTQSSTLQYFTGIDNTNSTLNLGKRPISQVQHLNSTYLSNPFPLPKDMTVHNSGSLLSMQKETGLIS